MEVNLEERKFKILNQTEEVLAQSVYLVVDAQLQQWLYCVVPRRRSWFTRFVTWRYDTYSYVHVNLSRHFSLSL